MKKKHSQDALVEAWSPPDKAGDPIGVITTTYTFEADLLEEECLPRFLQLQSDRYEDGPYYFLELEEKLAPLLCAAIWTDQQSCRSERSLRWDLFPIRKKGGILHAKLTLLVWSNVIRLIISSANLTRSGLATNKEVFQVLDFGDQDDAPVAKEAGLSLLSFLVFILREDKFLAEEVKSRSRQLLATATRRIQNHPGTELNAVRGGIKMFSCTTGLQEENVPTQISARWSKAFGPLPPVLDVLSPFYDEPEQENTILRSTLRLLSKSGKRKITFSCNADQTDNSFVVWAPPSLLELARAEGITVSFFDASSANDLEYRALHGKAVRMRNETGLLLMIGSSNFTSKGMGLAKNQNFEANIIVLVPAKNKEVWKAAFAVWPEIVAIPEEKLQFKSAVNTDEPDGEADCPLPPFLLDASLISSTPGLHKIKFRFDLSQPLSNTLTISDNNKRIILEHASISATHDSEIIVSIDAPSAPAGFNVTWDADKSGWLPLNILNAGVLPLPEELRDLPLDLLVQIIGSARPMHLVMRDWHRSKKENADTDAQISLDPHKDVNTSNFLLQRARRYLSAGTAVSERLSRPCFTKESLEWRLEGPIGLRAFVEALVKEAKSKLELQFLLTELLHEVWTIKFPGLPPGSLPAVTMRKKIREQLKAVLLPHLDVDDTGNLKLAAYTQKVLNKTVNVA